MPIIQDLRTGVRLTVRNPVSSLICVLALGIGLGLTAAVFSILNGMLLKPLPFEEPARLLSISHVDAVRGYRFLPIPLSDFQVYRHEQRAFEDLGGYRVCSFSVGGGHGEGAGAELYEGAWVTANIFDLLRIQPLLGRGFEARDEAPGAEPVTLIGYRLWQERFGGDVRVLGQALRINGEPATVVGVLEDEFMFPERQALWLPVRYDLVAHGRGRPGALSLMAIGRLRPNASIYQARAQLVATSLRLAAAYPETNQHLRVQIMTMADAFQEEWMGEGALQFFLMVLVAGFMVLLIACVNVASLLLSRVAPRSREVAVRKAFGASRPRLVAQLLTEPLILAGAGAVLGLGLASLGGNLFLNSIPSANRVYWVDFGLDGSVLLVVFGLALFSTLASGLIPALRVTHGKLGEILKEGGHATAAPHAARLTRWLVVAEFAVALVILTGAALMVRSVTHAMATEVPFPTEDVLTARIGFPPDYPAYTTVEDRVRFFETVESRLAQEPGIRASAVTTSLPGDRAPVNTVAVEGHGDDHPPDQLLARWAAVTPAFFDLFGVAVLEGRTFGFGDQAGRIPVAIVNQSFVRRHFPDGRAVGRRVRVGPAEAPWRTIVGVVPDLHMSGVHDRGQDREGLYIPLAQSSAPRFVMVAARTSGPPTLATPQVRDAVAAVDADIPVHAPRSLQDVISELAWDLHLLGRMVTIIGFVALFLAAIGLHGVVSSSVSRRTREMGVRMALGADSGGITRFVIRQGVTQLAIGLLLGSAGAMAVGRLLRGILWNISPHDPLAYGASFTVLTLAGFIALWVPARRAAKLDPLVAIRDQAYTS